MFGYSFPVKVATISHSFACYFVHFFFHNLILRKFSVGSFSSQSYFKAVIQFFHNAMKTMRSWGLVLTMFNSSNLALVKLSLKSSPSYRDSISIVVWCWEDKALLAFSTSRRSFCTARLSFLMSLPFFFLYSFIKCSITRWSKSSPPKWVSPLVATTSKTPSSMVRTETSKVPPPRSNTRMFFSPSFLSSP